MLDENSVFKKSIESSKSSESSSPPHPLYRKIPPPFPFPFRALGPILGNAARRIHELIKAPDGICGASILTAAASAAQGHRNVVRYDGEEVPISLFGISVAESGERKSAADRIALFEHKEFEKRMSKIREGESLKYKNKMEIYEKGRKKVLSVDASPEELEIAFEQLGPEPRPPLDHRIIVQDATVEAIFDLLISGPGTLSLFLDEGGRFIGGYGMQREQQLKTLSNFCKLWDGDDIHQGRRGSGWTEITGKRFSLHLMIQPILASTFLNDRLLVEQGFMPRCLVTWPSSMAGNRLIDERKLHQTTKSALDDPWISQYHDRIRELLNRPFFTKEDSLNELAPPKLAIGVDSTNAWIAYYNYIEKELQPNGNFVSIRGFASKAAEQVLRISAVLSLFENPDCTRVTLEHMFSAIELVDYFLSECHRLASVSETNPLLFEAEKLLNWMKNTRSGKGIDTFTSRYIQQHGPSSLRDKETISSLTKILVDHELIITLTNKSWRLNENESV